MKKVILLLFMSLTAIAIFAQDAKNEKVISVVKRAVQAQESYDPVTLEKVYASDYIEISPKGEIDPRDKAIGFYKIADAAKARAKTPRYILDEFQVRQYKDFVMIISKFSIAFKNDLQKPPSPVGLVLYGLRKEKGEWKIYSAQFTPFPPPIAKQN